jgi:hypothetical protein
MILIIIPPVRARVSKRKLYTEITVYIYELASTFFKELADIVLRLCRVITHKLGIVVIDILILYDT